MARRTGSSFNAFGIGIGIVVVVMVFLGARYFMNTASDPFRTYETLNVSAYLENANSLRGNTYKLQAEVLNALALSPTEGRLFSFGVKGNSDVVPVLIPLDFNHVNVQKGQQFDLLLEVIDNGLLRVKDMTKT